MPKKLKNMTKKELIDVIKGLHTEFSKMDDLEKKKHFEFLDSLPLEARIRKIEEWIYNYKPTYIPPPTF